jgi:DNA gyrase subunit A
MTELTEELKNSFMSYAMSTILSRALPDIRDGMKPVHRRVLYAMQVLNLTPDSGYRKCARVVGEVLGKFHPHGDLSVYDALVRMAQDFVMMHPLVSGHGNFGSIDNDPAAAMRYTEAKLSNIAYDSLLADIKDDTVDFIDNFDGNEIEPVVLPARLPWLLLNGASGIAVGMATNIPPHNLREIADAIVALVKDPTLSDEDLFKIVPAPDFPTGGKIIGTKGAHEMYRTGHGSVVMRADTHSEVITSSSKSGSSRSRDAIVITKLPYMTNKASLLEKIADLVNDKKLDGISDLRDESDRDGIRVVIELKRDAVPALVQNNLFKKTALQTSFSGNMLALVDEGRQPMRVTLRSALMDFIGFRFKTIRRRSQFQLGKLKVREHIVQGLMVALARMDEVLLYLSLYLIVLNA